MGRPHRPHSQENTSRNGEVVVVSEGVLGLHPQLREYALRQTRGDATRIEVLSTTECIIR